MNWTNPNFSDKEKNNIYIENETQTEVKQETNNSNFTPLSEILNNNDKNNNDKNNNDDKKITNNLKFEECCKFPKFATITGAPSNLSLDSASVGKLTTMHDSYLGKYLK